MKNIGMIAGNGRFPFLVAQEIKKQGDKVIAVALKEEADKEIETVCDETIWLSVGKIKKIIDSNDKTIPNPFEVCHGTD